MPEFPRSCRVLLCLFAAGMALFWNRAFMHPWPLPVIVKMNDVPFILSGYQHTQPLFPASLRWWHGPWIREGVAAYRPLSSYLYWADCRIGLHWGFLWTAWTGFALYLAAILLSAILTWRLTRSVLCTFFAIAFVSLERFFNAGQPDIWLAWFPVHHDLLMISLLLAALLCFDAWFAGGPKRWLVFSWTFFAAGCLAKEYVYVFPLFAGAVSALRPTGANRTRPQGWLQAALMLAAATALWVYRSSIIGHPHDASWQEARFFLDPILYMYFTLGQSLLTTPWMAGLAALLFLLASTVTLYRRSAFRDTRPGKLLGRPMIWLPLMLAIIALYLTCTAGSALEALWFFLDGGGAWPHIYAVAAMVFIFYTMFLVWKYRRQEPIFAAWLFLLLSYVPVLGFLGWHYNLPSYFLRAPYYALILKLIWIELGRPGLSLSYPPSLNSV